MAERRTEIAEESTSTFRDGFTFLSSSTIFPQRSQKVNSGYAELNIPIFSSRNPTVLLRELELQASVRHDRYETRALSPVFYVGPPPSNFLAQKNRFRSTDLTVGGRWSPVKDLSFRASYATGFLPPNIGQIVPVPLVQLGNAGFRDPRRGGQLLYNVSSPYLSITGGNTDLEPEKSKSLSVGIRFTPSPIPGLRVTVDYTRINKTGEIQNPISGITNLDAVAFLEENFPGRIIRGPLTPADQALGFTGGPVTVLDQTLVNIGRSNISALDIQADYEITSARLGEFRVYAVGTKQIDLMRQLRPGLKKRHLVGWGDGPLEWRIDAGVDWRKKNWAFGWNAQYYSGYRLSNFGTPNYLSIGTNGSDKVQSQVYHDVSVQYKPTDGANGILARWELAVGIQNVFDKRPPIIVRGPGVVGNYSSYGDPRLRRFTLAVSKQF